MSQTIQLSNGDELEFPDQMTDDQIHLAIQKEYSPKQENKSLNPNFASRIPGAMGQAASDVGNAALSIPGNIVSGLMSLPANAMSVVSQLPSAAKQVMTEPGRAARNVAGGLAEIGHKELNAPRAIGNYLAKIGLISPETASKIPEQKDINQDISQFVGEGVHPGDELLRNAAANLPSIIGAGKLASLVNPLKLTKKSIKNSVLNSEKLMKEKYSGPNGLYENLSKEAQDRGITGSNISPSSKDIETLKLHMPEDEYVAVGKLMKDKNISNAQNAISQLGHRERKLLSKYNRGDILTDPEKDLLKSVKNVKNHIQENMFKDENGNIHQDLLDKHRRIQEGYRKEVIPYTKNPAIQAFKNEKITLNQLIPRLYKGEFGAKRLKYHPAMGLRQGIKNAFGTKVGQGALWGTGAGISYKMMKELMGGND